MKSNFLGTIAGLGIIFLIVFGIVSFIAAFPIFAISLFILALLFFRG